MTAQIIDFTQKWQERQARLRAKEIKQLFAVDYSLLKGEQLRDFILNLAAFADQIEEVDYSLHSSEKDQT